MKANLHTHTFRCGHACGEDIDYVRAACGRGFEVLGFSDHMPWPYKSGFTHPSVRMEAAALPEYIASIRSLASSFRGKIRILTGFECEFFPEYIGWLQDVAEENSLDYLILGNHYDTSDETGMYFGRTETPDQLARYVEMTIRGLRTGLFSYLAHPDLFLRRWPSGFTADCKSAARDLCAACAGLHIPMEYNTHMRWAARQGREPGYPSREFFEIARESGVRVLIGLDAHDPEELTDPTQWDRAASDLTSLGIDRLEMPELRGFGVTGQQ